MSVGFHVSQCIYNPNDSLYAYIFMTLILSTWAKDSSEEKNGRTQCDTPTFILCWVDELVEVPVLAAAGHLNDMELTNTSLILGTNRSRLEGAQHANILESMHFSVLQC